MAWRIFADTHSPTITVAMTEVPATPAHAVSNVLTSAQVHIKILPNRLFRYMIRARYRGQYDKLPVRNHHSHLRRFLRLPVSAVQGPSSPSQIPFQSRSVARAAELPVHVLHGWPAGSRVCNEYRSRSRQNQSQLPGHSKRSQGPARYRRLSASSGRRRARLQHL